MEERKKELGCLYQMSRILNQPGITQDDAFQRIVNLIPPAWQYPNDTCAKINVRGREYTTSRFQISPWRQVSDIFSQSEKVGFVEVVFFGDDLHGQKTPFLAEERYLLDVIAEELGRIFEYYRIEETLENHNTFLRRIVEDAPGLVCKLSMTGDVIHLTTAGEILTGYRTAELMEKNWWTRLFPGDQYAQIEAMFNHFGTGDIKDHELALTMKNGQQRKVLWTAIRFQGEASEPIELLCFAKDIESSSLDETIGKMKERIAGWQNDLLLTERAKLGKAQGRGQQEMIATFIELSFQNIYGALSDLSRLAGNNTAGDVKSLPCHLLNCPRLDVLSSAIQDTIQVLEKTKNAFRSRDLGELRRRLEDVIRKTTLSQFPPTNE